MILVDSSVWIARLRGQATRATAALQKIVASEELLVGDLILLEVLQGARSEAAAERIERDLRRFKVVALLDDGLAVHAARNYRSLRRIGITMAKATDLIIATYCVERGHRLLHEDRDFDPMVTHLGLRTV